MHVAALAVASGSLIVHDILVKPELINFAFKTI